MPSRVSPPDGNVVNLVAARETGEGVGSASPKRLRGRAQRRRYPGPSPPNGALVV